VRWASRERFYTERSAYVWYQGCRSGVRKLELGIPQGGVLSPTLFNVLMNKVANRKYPRGVAPVIYADDILFQGNCINNVQLALNSFSNLARKMGLVVNEDKTIFQTKISNELLTLNKKNIEKVSTYK